MKLLISCLIAVVCFGATPNHGALTLDETLRAVVNRRGIEDIDVEIAQSRLRMLEAAAKPRVDWTPQLGLLSLANPIALATSFGAGLLWRQGAVSPAAVLDARLDVFGAELARRRRRFEREVELTRTYFEVTENQKLAERACNSVADATTRRDELLQRLSVALLTRADLLRHEQEILNRQVDCSQAGKRLAVSAARLSAMTGIPAETIRVADGFTDVLSLDHPLKPFDALVKVAFTHRAEPSTLREELTILRRQVRGSRPSRGFQFSMRYFNNGQGLGRAGNGAYFLGQGLLPEIAATLPLKHNDEFSAHQQLLLLKLDRLERELEEIERGIQLQIAEVHQQFQSAREEFRIARQRLAIAAEIRTVVLARYKAGLEGPASLDDAEYAERRADAEVIRVEYAGKLSLAQLLTVCGLRDDSLKRVETLFAARFSAPVVVFP